MIEAIIWKYPTAQLSIRGEQIFSNIQWHETSPVQLTETEVNQAISEYTIFLNNEALNKKKQQKKEELRSKKIDELIAPQIQAINNAQNEAVIDAVTL